MSLTIPQVVADAARRFPFEGLVDRDGDRVIRWTFAELAQHVTDVTRAFLGAGIAPGDRIAIWAPNIHEWILAALGAQGAGGVVVPLNTRFKGAEAAYVLGKSGARMLFCVNGFLGNDYVAALAAEDVPTLETVVVMRGSVPADATPGGRAAVQSWDQFLAGGAAVTIAEAEAAAAAVTPDMLSDIIFTSGTTGRPKGVMTTHGQTVRVFQDWSSIVGLAEGDRYLIINPFFHTFGYKAGFLACLLKGATIVPEPVFDVPTVLQRVGEERISMLPGPPTLYMTILNHPQRDDFDLSTLRLSVTGAAVVPVEMIRRMREELTFKTIVTGYGLTETTGTATMCRADDDPETIATTSGRAIPEVEVRIVDPEGTEVPRGTAGEVVVRGYNVMQGYFDEAEATAETIDADGWLHTGDIAVMDEAGYVTITDRMKDMFIVGGFNAYPAEIEQALMGHPQVAQVAVIGMPDDRQGEVGCAFVVPRPGETVDPAEVITWCRERMANYKVPRRVELVDALPLNASGKVLKFELRARVAG